LAQRRGSLVRMEMPSTSVTAEVDSRRLERILRNLLINAVEHGDGREIVVRVGADADAVAIVVRDHGVGLRPGEADVVFNRFWRADPARARSTGGTGLGLSIALEDARLHGGWLQAWGAQGKGAQFRLTLPRRAGAQLHTSPLPLQPDDALDDNASAAPTPAVDQGAVSTPPGASVPATSTTEGSGPHA
jgi:two-component system sensor histidine kinase MtrB